jgi:hypothetical protein
MNSENGPENKLVFHVNKNAAPDKVNGFLCSKAKAGYRIGKNVLPYVGELTLRASQRIQDGMFRYAPELSHSKDEIVVEIVMDNPNNLTDVRISSTMLQKHSTLGLVGSMSRHLLKEALPRLNARQKHIESCLNAIFSDEPAIDKSVYTLEFPLPDKKNGQ